ncbi:MULTISPECIES: type II toxin-antitoxin system RelE/ParE family toxin [unclassified Microcoleus]|uniref:type II toxin-antitoxin system RelE family toxin n=1 Tax=unclassified Microcoleus TaxID=2642155 RepID=UPI0025D4685F|nr:MULTISPECIES: type II toxin-antitoxin system RelE/ParE family toxin [unclassified Microcoleus]
MNVEFIKSFEKDLNNLREQSLLQRIQAVIEEVEEAENLANISNLKKLKADGNYYRIRVGDYRIGMTADENIVIFVRVLHRKEVYRYFP